MGLAILLMLIKTSISHGLSCPKASGQAMDVLTKLRGFPSSSQTSSCLPHSPKTDLATFVSCSDWHGSFYANGCLHLGDIGGEAGASSSWVGIGDGPGYRRWPPSKTRTMLAYSGESKRAPLVDHGCHKHRNRSCDGLDRLCACFGKSLLVYWLLWSRPRLLSLTHSGRCLSVSKKAARWPLEELSSTTSPAQVRLPAAIFHQSHLVPAVSRSREDSSNSTGTHLQPLISCARRRCRRRHAHILQSFVVCASFKIQYAMQTTLLTRSDSSDHRAVGVAEHHHTQKSQHQHHKTSHHIKNTQW